MNIITNKFNDNMLANNKSLFISQSGKNSLIHKKKDSVLEGIENQIRNAQEKIAELSENKELSVQEKIDKKKNLMEQLEELNKERVQRNLEIREEKREDSKKKQIKEQNNKDEHIKEKEEMNLISLTLSLGQISNQKSVSSKMKGSAKILESEIKLDRGRGLDVRKKEVKLKEFKSRINELNEKIKKNFKNVNEEIKKNNSQSGEAAVDELEKRGSENKKNDLE